MPFKDAGFQHKVIKELTTLFSPDPGSTNILFEQGPAHCWTTITMGVPALPSWYPARSARVSVMETPFPIALSAPNVTPDALLNFSYTNANEVPNLSLPWPFFEMIDSNWWVTRNATCRAHTNDLKQSEYLRDLQSTDEHQGCSYESESEIDSVNKKPPWEWPPKEGDMNK